MAEATAAETEATTAYEALTQKNKVSRTAKTEEAKGKENEVRAEWDTSEDARFVLALPISRKARWDGLGPGGRVSKRHSEASSEKEGSMSH